MFFSKDNRMIRYDLISLIIIIISIIAVYFGVTPEKFVDIDEGYDVTTGWVDANGKPTSLKELENGDVTLTLDTTNYDLHKRRLCFKSSDTHIKVLADGKEVYSYAPTYPNILGKSYGLFLHTIDIPPEANTITLQLHPVYDDSRAHIKAAAIQDSGDYMDEFYRTSLPGFTLCAVIVLFGVLMLIIGFTTIKTSDSSNVNFFSLGTFAILVGVWSASDTYVMQVLTQRPEIMRFASYLCLIFIAYMPVSIMAKSTKFEKPWMLWSLFGLILTNFVVTIVLSAMGITDVYKMLTFSHFNIIVALAMTLFMMIRAIVKKEINRKFLNAMLFGMGCAVVCVIIDMLRYKFVHNKVLEISFFTRIGVLIFVVTMAFCILAERKRLAIEKEHSLILEKMAYTDGLTGIGNRAAFHDAENEVRESDKDYTIIQFDINYLKKVNDEHGHAEGDKHIIKTASIIEQCFGEMGTCYRIGGDEFVVIANSCSDEEVEDALLTLDRLCDSYNKMEKPPISLEISYGFAHYNHSDNTLEDAEKLADERMYAKKREMKSRA